MNINPFFQPVTGQAGELLAGALAALGAPRARLIMLVAWARASGVGRMAAAIRQFRAAGGSVQALVGIDKAGTSVEGLLTLLNIVDDAYVIHDRSRSFHPKVYAVKSEDHGMLLVGSGNLTRGGLYTNYEYFDMWNLDLREENEASLMAAMERQVEHLLKEGQTARRLTRALIRELSRRGLVKDERKSGDQDEPDTGPGAEGLFGSRTGLPGAPPLTTEFRPKVKPSKAGQARTPKFAKRLSRNDLQATGSHQSGVYVPKPDLASFPALNARARNPETWIRVADAQGRRYWWRFVYFNGKLHRTSTRNEYRLTSTGDFFRDHPARPGSQLEMDPRGANTYLAHVRRR